MARSDAGWRDSYRLLPFSCVPLSRYDVLTRVMSTGSPWGAGTFAGADGSRKPTALELEVAEIQGRTFWETVSKVKF